jgi:hypothetical protein
VKTTDTDEWYVGFVPCPNRGVWRLARGRCSHCMAFRQLDKNQWLLVEANVWGVDALTMTSGQIARLMTLAITKGHLFLSPSRRRPQRTLPAPLLTCASITAGLIGLPGWYFTPGQLMRRLQRSGARVISRQEVDP